MTNHFNAEQGVYVTVDSKGIGRTSRYLGNKWQDNTGHASPYMGFEERWHWQPGDEAEELLPVENAEQKTDTFSYLGVYAKVLPADDSSYKNCACPTFTPVRIGSEYACQQVCDGSGPYESLASCLQNHPQGPGGGGGFPPGYDGMRYVIANSGGLPNGIVHPDSEYGPCSQNSSGFYTAWTYSQLQAPEVTSGNGNDLALAMVVSGSLFTEGRPLPRIGSLPILNAGVDRWTPYASPVLIEFGDDAELKALVNTAAVKSRIKYDLYSGQPGDPLGGFIKTCKLKESTWPTRVIGLGLMGIAYGEWENCPGAEARYMFTLPNNYPGWHQADNATGDDSIWCGWGEFTNSQTGASSGRPTLPASVAGVAEFWSSDSCPDGGGGQYNPPVGPPGQYDPEYSNKELYYFRNGMAEPELIATINAGEPVRVFVSPQERQFIVAYGQKPKPFRQGPNNFCKAVHISRAPAQAGMAVTTDASNLTDSAYVNEKIGRINPFALAALTDAPFLPSPLLIKVNGSEPWALALPNNAETGYTVFMQNNLLADAKINYPPDGKSISQMLFEQDEPFKPLFLGLKPFEATAVAYSMQKAVQVNNLPSADEAVLLAFGVNTSKKLKPI